MKILSFTKYTYKGPSSRYRHYNFINCFNKADIELEIHPLFSNEYLSCQSKLSKIFYATTAYIKRFFQLLHLIVFARYRLIIIEYELFPFLPGIFERFLKYRKIKYIVDYDDAIFHRYDSHDNFFIRNVFKNKIAKIIEYAHRVIVGSQYLYDYSIKFNKMTYILPTVVQLEKYLDAIKSYDNIENNDFIIGWIGSGTTSKYILDIMPALKSFSQEHEDVKYNFIGFDSKLLSEKELSDNRIRVIPWSEESEIYEILNFDIGIMPLTNDSWSKGKCGFKLIQYMSCGKPVIASPVGENVNIVTDSVNGFLATNTNEWVQAFDSLYNDRDLYKSMSHKNLGKIKDNYNFKIICEKYIHIITGIIDGK